MPSASATKSKTNGKPGPKHNIDAVREEFYERISQRDMAPLWKVMSSVVTTEPVTRVVPHVWRYSDVKSLVMESGGLITAEEAKRRVLILENPAMHGESKATNTLFAGIQMILPGEVAPAHRHVSSAIRFVLDGEGAYTAVEGEKAFMSPGDFVITANWAPHDHGNTSDQPGGRGFAQLLRLGRAARWCACGAQPQPRDQLHLCAHAADHRAHAQSR